MADDKRAPSALYFTKGDIGFVFRDGIPGVGAVSSTWAFSTIEDAAAWLVEQFAPTPTELSPNDWAALTFAGEKLVAARDPALTVAININLAGGGTMDVI